MKQSMKNLLSTNSVLILSRFITNTEFYPYEEENGSVIIPPKTFVLVLGSTESQNKNEHDIINEMTGV